MVKINSAVEFGKKHGEAFMLMLYACRKCKYQETIWNSRDGVTPFGCECPKCGKIMNHVNWGQDVYAEKHKLFPLQRFWRDGTPDEAEEIMRRRIANMHDLDKLEPDVALKLLEQARLGLVEEFRPGWPMLDRNKK